MKYDWRFSQKSKCSDREKQQSMELVADLVNLSKLARRNGLLSLIQVAEQNQNFLLNKGLQLVVDGVNPQVVRSIMENYIISGDYEGAQLLQRCIIMEGLSAIQQGFHPKVTKELLLSFLGEENYAAYQKKYDGGDQSSLKSYLQEIEDIPASSTKGSELDQLILECDDDAIAQLLMEINTRDLATSIRGMGGKAQIKIFDSLSEKAADGLKDTLDELDDIDAAELAKVQQMLIDTITDILTQTNDTTLNGSISPGFGSITS